MELPIRLSKTSREPIYHQIENQIKALIAGGYLQTGSPLPSIRLLAKDLETSVITIRRAYQNLEYQGFIQTEQGKGTFVAEIAKEKKQQVKITSVYQAFENALDVAISYEYTVEQIKEIFEEVLESRSHKGDANK
ncbi:GntR family transcriptional regulator [Oceanobacillus manasiensis]|uniref:GntR family transcriptional regulator n=1 Tax=Oceanobacillus manasiensis TaxID=586413 RepID=UPI0005A631C1|nr:GntR family transcriptional regulator [Oceanobacillus manasiensis]